MRQDFKCYLVISGKNDIAANRSPLNGIGVPVPPVGGGDSGGGEAGAGDSGGGTSGGGGGGTSGGGGGGSKACS